MTTINHNSLRFLVCPAPYHSFHPFHPIAFVFRKRQRFIFFVAAWCIFLTSLQMCGDREASAQLSIEEVSLKRDCVISHGTNPLSLLLLSCKLSIYLFIYSFIHSFILIYLDYTFVYSFCSETIGLSSIHRCIAMMDWTVAFDCPDILSSLTMGSIGVKPKYHY